MSIDPRRVYLKNPDDVEFKTVKLTKPGANDFWFLEPWMLVKCIFSGLKCFNWLLLFANFRPQWRRICLVSMHGESFSPYLNADLDLFWWKRWTSKCGHLIVQYCIESPLFSDCIVHNVGHIQEYALNCVDCRTTYYEPKH